MKKALITGITGQDGAYLASLLLSKGYEVVGTFRRTSSTNFWRLDELGVSSGGQLRLVEHDLTDLASSLRLIDTHKPQELYNLAAQSFVGVSFDQPITTANITGIGALNLLEAIRIVDPAIKYYQASTSEMFGLVQEVPQRESTPFYPRSPYGTAKLFAHWSTINYRESYGIFAASGILFNHESPLRGEEFVTRKITSSIARIARGSKEVLQLGNMDAERDWGFAGDFVEGMWKMLQAAQPDTFVLATGKKMSVRSFLEASCHFAGLVPEFVGSGENESVVDRKSGRKIVEVSPKFYRPAEVDLLIGDSTKARSELGWSPSVGSEELCHMMVEADLQRVRIS